MNWQFVVDMIGAVSVLLICVGVFGFAYCVSRDHDRAERAKARAKRDVELAALRRIGLDTRRPLDVQV